MSFNDGFSIKPVPWPPNTPVSGNTLIYNGNQWVANTVYDDTVWYGVARLGTGNSVASWSSDTTRFAGATDVIDNLSTYLKCNWKFVDSNGEHYHGPFADTGSFETYVNQLKATSSPNSITYSQPYDNVDNTIPKLNDFSSNNLLWSMLFNFRGGSLWSKNSIGYNAVVGSSTAYASALSDGQKQTWLTSLWNDCFQSTPFTGDWNDPISYSCFWRATSKHNLWVWNKQFAPGNGPQLTGQRTTLDISDSSLHQQSGYEPFEVDTTARTSILFARTDLSYVDISRMTLYTTRQKHNNVAPFYTSVLGIPLQSTLNPNRKALYLKPVSQDKWAFRLFDDTKYVVEAVIYGGRYVYNGYPKIKNMSGIGFEATDQNVKIKYNLEQVFGALKMRPENKIRFRLRDINTGRVGAFCDSAMVVTRDRNNRDLLRLLQKSPE
jgi:hypothetical protein